jgi:hypothetical protein
MENCRSCGSKKLIPYETKPPVKHDGPCTAACILPGFLCLNCRMFHPKA